MSKLKKLGHTSFRPLREVILSHTPILLGILFFWISEHELTFANLLGKGEMVALCIPLILISIVKIYDNKNESVYGFSFLNTVFFAAIIFNIIAVFYYTIYVYSVFEIKNDNIVFMSFTFLFVSISSLWVAEYNDPSNLSIEGKRSKDQKDLESGFNSLREG